MPLFEDLNTSVHTPDGLTGYPRCWDGEVKRVQVIDTSWYLEDVTCDVCKSLFYQDAE